MNTNPGKDILTQNAIDWNKKEFFRAINQERWGDAKRFKENIEKLEETRP